MALAAPVILEPHAFVVVWTIVFCMRACTTLVLLGIVWYFNWLAKDTSVWRRQVHALSPTAIHQVTVFFAIMLVFHAYKLGQLVSASLNEGKLLFRATERLNRHESMVTENANRCASIASPVTAHPKPAHEVSGRTKATCSLRQMINAVSTSFQTVSNLFGVLGIRSKWFHEVFAIRESIELATQTYQVYRMQCLLANDRINGIALVALFLSSISTLVIESWTRDHGQQSIETRLALMMTDASLDFVFAIAIPMFSQVAFLEALNISTMTFVKAKLFDMLWFVTSIRWFQQFSMTSEWDIASTIIFQIGLFYCLMKVQDIVQRKDQIAREVTVTRSNRHINTMSYLLGATREGGPPPFLLAKRLPRSRRHRILQWVPVVHALLGVVAVVASLHARFFTRPAVNGCLLSGYEWFKSHPVCIMMEINCYRRQINGNAQSIHAILVEMDTKWLFSLFLNHCEALEIPQSIQSIPTLYLLQVYNSTLASWNSSAALTESTNPQITMVRFIRTTLPGGEVPPGLLSTSFPSSMACLFFEHTNLQSLPPEVFPKWSELVQLYIDHSRLTEVPLVLSKLSALRFLYLTNGSFKAIPEGFLDQFSKLTTLRLSGGALKQLPTQLHNPALERSCYFEIEHTAITSIPQWLQALWTRFPDNAPCSTSAFGSPICSNRFTRRLIGRELPLDSIKWLLARCFTDLNSINGWGGMEQTDRANALQST